MSATDALVAMLAYLRADPTLSGYVSNRIYARRAAVNATPPYIVYQRISDAREYNQTGPDGLPTMRVQFAIWDTDPGRLPRVGDALVNALERIHLSTNLRATIATHFDRDDTAKNAAGQIFDGVQVDAMLTYRE